MRIPFLCPKGQTPRKSQPLIEVMCVAYKRYGPLKVLVHSFLNQSAKNWRLNVIHDGSDAQFEATMAELARDAEPGKIAYRCTEARHNDYGHSLRAMGIAEAQGTHLLLTNDDNYYIPKFVELVTESIQASDPDVVYFDMIHSHNKPGGRRQPAYCLFKTEYKRQSIDMGAAVVRTDLAKAAGFRDKTHDGDATYFEDVAAAKGKPLKLRKIERVLFVHN